MKLFKIFLLLLLPALMLGQKIRNHQINPGPEGTVKTTDGDGNVSDIAPTIHDFVPGAGRLYNIGEWIRFEDNVYKCVASTDADPSVIFSTPPGQPWVKRFEYGVEKYVEGTTYPDSALVNAGGIIYRNVLGADNGSTIPGDSWENLDESFDVASVANYDKLRTYDGDKKTIIVEGDGVGGLFVADNSATPDSGVVIQGSNQIWRRADFDGEYNPIWYGAKRTSDANDVALNTDVIQRLLDRGGLGKTVRVPNGVWYDWTDLIVPDFTTIHDNSGFDGASGSGGLQQSYSRTISRTDANTGMTNGNSTWMTGDYHPSFAAHNVGTIGTTEARASFLMWQKSGNSPYVYGTQMVQELTDLTRPRYSILSYNLSSGDLRRSKAVLNFTHAFDRDRVGAMGFNIQEPSAATYEYGVEGLPENNDVSSPSWLAKNMITYKSLPQDGTGIFDMIWRPGVQSFWYRRAVKINQVEYTYAGADGFKEFLVNGSITTESDGTRYGQKQKITNMASSNALIGTTYVDGVYTNSNNTSGGVAKNLPQAIVGNKLTFYVVNDEVLRLVPFSGDKFADRPAGEYMQSSQSGSSLKIFCHTPGVWAFARTGKWTNQSGGVADGDNMGDNDAGGNEVTNAAAATSSTSLATLQQVNDVEDKIAWSDESAGTTKVARLTSTSNGWAEIYAEGNPVVRFGDLGSGNAGTITLIEAGVTGSIFRASGDSWIGGTLAVGKSGAASEALEVVGNAKADAFIGDGSQLTGIPLSRGITASVTTDANGSVVIPHSFGVVPTAIALSARGADYRYSQVTSKTTTNFGVKVFLADGTPAANVSFIMEAILATE